MFAKRSMLQTLVLGLSLSLLAGCGKGGSNQAAVQKTKADLSQAGSVSGVVKLDGTAPKSSTIEMSADPICSTQHKSKVDSGEVMVKGGKIQNVIVYVKSGLEALSFDPNTTKVTLDQKGCMYEPHVFCVQTGQPIEIVNSDKTLHNIHALVGDKTLFNLGMPQKGMKLDQSLSDTGVVTVKCDVHSWMKGYIGVFDHPCFAVTGADGSFTIKNLPPGKYTIEAWHEKFGVQDMEIQVGPKENKKQDFTLKSQG